MTAKHTKRLQLEAFVERLLTRWNALDEPPPYREGEWCSDDITAEDVHEARLSLGLPSDVRGAALAQRRQRPSKVSR